MLVFHQRLFSLVYYLQALSYIIIIITTFDTAEVLHVEINKIDNLARINILGLPTLECCLELAQFLFCFETRRELSVPLH